MTSSETLDDLLAPVRARIRNLEHALEEAVNARMRDRDAFEEELHRWKRDIQRLENQLSWAEDAMDTQGEELSEAKKKIANLQNDAAWATAVKRWEIDILAATSGAAYVRGL